MEGINRDLFQNFDKEKIIPSLIYLIVPVILIATFYFNAKELLQYPIINFIVPNFIHYELDLLAGNLLAWAILFACLIIMGYQTPKFNITLILLLLLFPFFRFIVSVLLYGGYNFSSWGFSGYCFIVYGYSLALMITGIVFKFQKRPAANYIVIPLILIIAILPLILTPQVIPLENGGYLRVSTFGHQIGFLWGFVVPFIINQKIFEVRYWYIGIIPIIYEIFLFGASWF